MTQRPTAMKVVVIEPKVFEDSENITHQLRDMRPVLINFENTDPHGSSSYCGLRIWCDFCIGWQIGKSR